MRPWTRKQLCAAARPQARPGIPTSTDAKIQNFRATRFKIGTHPNELYLANQQLTGPTILRAAARSEFPASACAEARCEVTRERAFLECRVALRAALRALECSIVDTICFTVHSQSILSAYRILQALQALTKEILTVVETVDLDIRSCSYSEYNSTLAIPSCTKVRGEARATWQNKTKHR